MTSRPDPAAPGEGKTLAVVLAAGEGTRMRSAVPKVLHRIAGRSMLAHLLATLGEAGIDHVAVVVGPDREDVAAEARRSGDGADVHVQQERLGTAHAVLAARASVERHAPGRILVMFADCPLVRPATIAAMRAAVGPHAALAVLGFEAADPTGYGRLVLRDGALVAIREEKDASEAERAITFCNSGLMSFAGDKALAILDRIDQANAQREFYLTQAVEIARAQGLDVAALRAPEDELIGINDRVQLAAVEAVVQRGLRERAMRGGATLVAPETVMLAWDTRLGRDVLVEPNVVFGPGVTVEDEATVRAFSHLEGARVAKGAQVGPYARLRPGTAIEAKARIGNFVEVKAALVGAGAKVNHLAYVGDAEIGAGANIGAGAITCNYDGFRKSRTTVGAGAFIGSNVALVAPVTVGAGAIVAAGSTITKSVEPDALAVARGRQEGIAGWAARLRARRTRHKGEAAE